MCGICGVYRFDQRPVDMAIVRRMTGSIQHRGPDEDGFHNELPVGLGMRRLSIIDLEGGRQPVHNEDQTVFVVFNGEIYGYVELRAHLERLGHRFATRSDTETIVHAYEEYGTNCVSHLNGVFAFAIWDAARRELFMARDRLGEKPLFYTRIGDQLVFASEIKALLEYPGCSRDVSDESITQYLSALYIPHPATIFRHIHKLPPGSCMRVTAEGFKVRRYWEPELTPQRRVTVEDAAEEFTSLFRNAVKLQLRSDVPVGVSVSSGLDSNSVVAQAAALASGPLKTFSVGFEGADWDELPGAQSVSRMYETDHFEIKVSPRDVLNLLPRLVTLMDEPLGDGAMVPVYMVSKLAREHVKVILNGTGGDELLAGYPRYRLGLLSPVQRLVKSAPGPLKDIAATLGGFRSPGFQNRVRVALRSIEGDYCDANTWFKAGERAMLTGSDDTPFSGVISEHYLNYRSNDTVTRLTYVDMKTYLADDLLPLTDRMTMGVSLEGRLPFLDYRLVEWALSLPGTVKLHNGVSKYVLRRAMAERLPAEVLKYPKRGFGPPYSVWLHAGLLELTSRLLASPAAQRRGLYRGEEVRRLLASNIDDYRTAQRIWMLLVLEIWFRLYIDGDFQTDCPPTLDALV